MLYKVAEVRAAANWSDAELDGGGGGSAAMSAECGFRRVHVTGS